MEMIWPGWQHRAPATFFVFRGLCSVTRRAGEEQAMIKGFQDLVVWQKAHKLVLEVYKLTNLFPRNEQFGMVSQLRRAGYSVPSNIAEGYGRRSTKELLQFLAIANGSAEELRYFLILSRDLRYISPQDEERLNQEITSVVQMIAALARSLKGRESASVPTGPLRDTGHETRVTSRGARTL
jgi:four helix bundle protein